MSELLILVSQLVALAISGLFIYGVVELVRNESLRTRVSKEVRAHVDAVRKAFGFTRTPHNPVVTPGGQNWEAEGVLNPGAVEVDGDVHLFYRAIGSDGVSRIGYASSAGGDSFPNRLPYPVFALQNDSEDDAAMRARTMANHTGLAASGGSWSGVEDPRAVVIDDTLYLTFSAFAGWDSVRMGLTSLSLEDLRAKKWKWTPPVYLSPKGQVHKNWVLFPEKINGKYAVLHSLHGGSHEKVLVDYFDTLENSPAVAIESPDPNALPDNPKGWHKRVRGAGPPPIKTDKGWLVLYHAIDNEGPSHYKLGALLLDLQDPTTVIARSIAPILAPTAAYENEGAKAGVVYACGAIVKGDVLTIYYGGADSVICSATHSLSKLLTMMTDGAAFETMAA
ncbi:glycosidase [soil metagenome]